MSHRKCLRYSAKGLWIMAGHRMSFDVESTVTVFLECFGLPFRPMYGEAWGVLPLNKAGTA